MLDIMEASMDNGRGHSTTKVTNAHKGVSGFHMLYLKCYLGPREMA